MYIVDEPRWVYINQYDQSKELAATSSTYLKTSCAQRRVASAGSQRLE